MSFLLSELSLNVLTVKLFLIPPPNIASEQGVVEGSKTFYLQTNLNGHVIRTAENISCT